jgi:hypothetical protein
MSIVWAIIGIVLIIALGAAGLLAGEVDRSLSVDPEELERRRAEEKRKQEWRDRLK